MKKLLGIAASAVLLASCFTACGKDKDKKSDSKFVGNWQSTKMIANGTEMTDLLGIPLNALVHLVIEDNGKCRMESPMEADESEKGTWKEDGDKVTVTLETSDEGFSEDNNVQVLEYKDGTLVLSGEAAGQDGELILEKVTEFATFDMESWKNDLQQSFGDLDLGNAQ